MVTEIPQLWQKKLGNPSTNHPSMVLKNWLMKTGFLLMPHQRFLKRGQVTTGGQSLFFLFEWSERSMSCMVKMKRRFDRSFPESEREKSLILFTVEIFCSPNNGLQTRQLVRSMVLSQLFSVQKLSKLFCFFVFCFLCNLLYCSILYGDFWRKKEGKKWINER